MDYDDKSLTCIDCGNEFIFTKNEQAFYAERGFTNEPKRCRACRDKRKSGRDRDGGGGQRDRAMVSIVCDECGRNAEVPFTPVSGKPVYCRECFNRRRDERRASGSY